MNFTKIMLSKCSQGNCVCRGEKVELVGILRYLVALNQPLENKVLLRRGVGTIQGS